MTRPADVARRWWREIPVYGYALLCALLCVQLWSRYGIEYSHENTVVSFDVLYLAAVVFLFFRVCWGLAQIRPRHPLAWFKSRYFSVSALAHFAGALPSLAICVVLIPIFSSLKAMIPLFNSFGWDATFIAWDRALFFGHDPWKLLQPIFGYPIITALIALLYNVWILLLYLGVVVVALSNGISDDLRRRFFLSYAMAWSLVGGLLATVFASVGPVFAEPILGIATFEPQVDYLRSAHTQIPVLSVPVQDMLLEAYQSEDGSLGRGISAMPSMHMAICALFWLLSREVSITAGRFFFWYMIVIWIGSVHLAYHYAVDGIVSLVAMWAIWKAAPIIFKAWDAIPLQGRQPALRTNTVPAE